MNKYILVVASLLIGAGGAWAANKLVSLSGKAAYEVTLSGGNKNFDKVETRFFQDTYNQQLYKFTAHTYGGIGLDGMYQEGTLETYGTKKTMFDTLVWSKKVKGAEFEIFGDELVQVTEFGCCDSPSINRLYNRVNGVQVEAAQNETTLEVNVPNTHLPFRYLASVVDSKAPLKKGTKTYVGTISYFDAQNIKGRVRVYAELPEGWGTRFDEVTPVLNPKDEVQGHRVTVWSADKINDAVKAYSGIGLTGHVYFDDKNETFSVVITGDQIDRALSKASPNLELEFQ